MKKTKYISIAYLLFITCAILIAFIDAKANGREKGRPQFEKKSFSYSLSDFNSVVVSEKTKITFVNDTLNQLNEFYWIKKEEKNTIEKKKRTDYKISGDTLFINATNDHQLSIKCKNIESIISKEKSVIKIIGFTTKNLNIISDNSKINASENKIKNLNIKSVNRSVLNFHNSKIDTLKLVSNDSKTYNIRNKTMYLNVVLNDSSYLKASEPLNLNIVSDITSRYKIEGK